MEENKPNESNLKKIPFEKIGMYIAIVGSLLMFWQFVRDFHKDIADIKERTCKIEEKLKHYPDPELKAEIIIKKQ